MKKLYIFVLAQLLVCCAFGQPAFTNGDFFTAGAGVGDTFKQGYFNNVYQRGMGMESETGTNYTWDFNANMFYTPGSLDYYCPATIVPTTYSYFPPGTNIRETSGLLSVDNLFQKLADTVYMTRSGTSSTTGTYMIPKLQWITFPLNYGDSRTVRQKQYSDTFMTTATFTRTQTYSYDGFGKVKLPWGDFPAVYRIKMTTRDSSHLTANYVITYSAYYFFVKGDGIPIVRLISTCIGDSVSHAYNVIANKNAMVASSVRNIHAKAEVQLYPNPAKGQLFLKSEGSDQLSVVISDMKGKQLIATQTTGKLTEVSLDKLAAGVYLVTVTDADRNVVSYQKLVKTE